MLTLALILGIMSALHPQPCAPQFAPLRTGSHSGASKTPFWPKQDAGGWRGDGWIGWQLDGDALVPVRLDVRDRPKASDDDRENVNVVADPDVDFAVRCIPAMRTGPITNGHVLNEELIANPRLTIRLGTHRYEVRLESKRRDLSDARVIVSDGRRKQVLYSADGFADDPHYEIEWAGDLDGDGKLDLVVNLHRKYSWNPHTLWLSSRASTRQLIGRAAVFVDSD